MEIVRRLLFAVFWLLVTAVPVMACPKCFSSGGERVWQAYYTSFFILSSIPLSFIGIGFALYWRWRRLNRHARGSPQRS